MRLIGDEHIAPKIVTAVCEIALSRSWAFDTVVKGSPYSAIEDEDWIAAFSRDGGDCVVSADREMLKRATFLQKITQTGLILVCLPKDYAEGRRQFQAAKMLYWWPKIEECVANSERGKIWIVPKGLGGGELREYSRRLSKSERGRLKAKEG